MPTLRKFFTRDGSRATTLQQEATFDARPYAFRAGRVLPVLRPLGVPDVGVLGTATYFVTLSLVDRVEHEFVDPPERGAGLWTPDADNQILERMDFSEMLTLGLSSHSIALPKSLEGVEDVAPSLVERRLFEDHPLVSRKAIGHRPNP